MRTTLNIDDEALMMIRKYAEGRAISLGQAASDLVHRGTESLPQLRTKNGWVVFDVAQAQQPLTNESVSGLEQAEYAEEYQRAVSPRR